jgi:hypothetical protein
MALNLFKRSLGVALTGASLLTVGCVRQETPLPPLPALPQNCTFTSTPDVAVPANQGVRISVSRRGIEPSWVSIAVRIDDRFRQDGSIYVPGPDTSFHPYRINNAKYFAPGGDSTLAKHFTASMLWSSTGVDYDQPPAFSVLCLSVEGATISFHAARTPQPNSIVRFDFYPTLPGPAKEKRPKPAAEQPAS